MDDNVLLIDSGLRRSRVLATIHNMMEEDPAKHITSDDAQRVLLSNLPQSMIIYGTNLREVHPQMPAGIGAKKQQLQEAMFELARHRQNYYWSGYHGGDERIAACLSNAYEHNLVKKYFPPFFIHPGFWLLIRLFVLVAILNLIFG